MPKITSRNPADLSDRVTEVEGADVAAFTATCRAARGAQPAWAAVPAPLRGREGNVEVLAHVAKAAVAAV